MGLLVNYLSVCSGIEAATVAWHDMGWKPIGFSEIEKFPSQLLQHHYPHVTNYGDMTKFKEWNINDTVGLLVGGTPCQSFSVAGLRKGLEDPRGNLMLTYLGIADHFKPKWILWENVPGVLSSNGGKDFACFLQGLAELGYGFAYRVLDAQHFGVPQRRRRVFVVGCFGDWRSAAKVLFESESLSRDITPSRKKRKEATSFTTSSFGSYSEGVGTIRANGGDIGGGSENLYVPPIAHCLQTTSNDYSRADGFNMVTQVYETHPTDSRVKEMGDVCQTITSRWGTGGGNVPIALAGNTIGRQPMNGGNGNGFTENGPMYTLTKTDVHGVAFPISWDSELNPNIDKMGTLMRGGQGGRMDGVMQTNMKVRRLTPIECERLQGFSDNYTNIKENCPDGHRYKALGNSMAVPVMRWIGQRINELS
jgi:DNA (cytosine-5)-methyltransferase 1